MQKLQQPLQTGYFKSHIKDSGVGEPAYRQPFVLHMCLSELTATFTGSLRVLDSHRSSSNTDATQKTSSEDLQLTLHNLPTLLKETKNTRSEVLANPIERMNSYHVQWDHSKLTSERIAYTYKNI